MRLVASGPRRGALALMCGVGALCSAACGPDAGVLYITSGVTDEVLILSARDGEVVGRLSLDLRPGEMDEPHGITVSPDGDHLYVTVAHGDPTLWKYELPANRLVGRVALGAAGAARVDISPDGRRAFIPDYNRAAQGAPGRLTVVGLRHLDILQRPAVCAAPHHADVSPDGRIVAVACALSDEVVILDAGSLQERARVDLGSRPLNLAWAPDGRRLFVTLHLADELRALTPEGGTAGSAPVGHRPAQLALTPDGRLAVIANRGDGSASIVDLRAMTEILRVPLDVAHPHGVAIDDHGATAFVAYEGDNASAGGVVAFTLPGGEIRWRRAAGAFVLGIAYRTGDPRHDR